MKMRKRIAALIAVAMIAALMPMSAFAASTNTVTKVVTVKKDSTIDKSVVPFQKIEVKDAMPTNQSFYLDLEGAEWADVEDLIDVAPGGAAVAGEKDIFTFTAVGSTFEAHREKDKSIAIRLISGTEFEGIILFPLLAKVTDSEAFILVDKFDTEISDSKLLFAVSDGDKVKVTVGDAPNFYRSGTIADITLEELYANSIQSVKNKDGKNERWITLELRDTDFQFAATPNGAKIEGSRAYRRANAQELELITSYKTSADGTKLGILISDDLFKGAAYERGVLTIKGIEIIASRDAKDGEVKAVIDGKELFGKETIVVAKRGDFATKLAVDKDWDYDVVAGTEKEVEFTLTESLANALIGGRPATFTFDKGVKISTGGKSSSKTWEEYASDNDLWDDVSSVGKTQLDTILTMPEGTAAEITAKNLAMNKWIADFYRPTSSRPGRAPKVTGQIEIKGDYDEDKGFDGKVEDARIHLFKDLDSFTVDEFKTDQSKAGKYTFKVNLLIPAGVTGDVSVSVAGKGLTEETIKILEVEAPVEVDATKMDIKVGLKEIETTGKIVIKETAEERLAQGKDIVLEVDDIDRGLKIKSFKATVVEGDLVLGDVDDMTVAVKRVSTEASTIEITDIVMFTDRTVPEGKYDLLIGGNAISDLTFRTELDDDIDPVVVVKDFINITTKNTEDLSGSANKATVAFVVGSNEYLVNGKVETMDVAPYIKDGRTMVPVRYVAAALGVRGDQVIWDQVNQTATVLADKTIQVKLGSKMMVIDGVSVPMTAAAELTSDRTFVPVAEIARALNVPTAWDTENATATFN